MLGAFISEDIDVACNRCHQPETLSEVCIQACQRSHRHHPTVRLRMAEPRRPAHFVSSMELESGIFEGDRYCTFGAAGYRANRFWGLKVKTILFGIGTSALALPRRITKDRVIKVRDIAVGLMAFALFCWTSVAHARVDPQSTAELPSEAVHANLVLEFSAAIDLQASVVEVRDSRNRRIEIGKLHLADNGVDVEIPLDTPLPPGSYTIKWRAVSTDGGESSGGYAFTIDPVINRIPAVAQQ
jgi:copper resistance protein C